MQLRPLIPVVVASAALLVAGCHKDEVRVIEGPKDVAAGKPGMSGGAAASSGDDERAGTPWVVPAGWTKKAAGGMRIASYGVTNADGRSVDISVVALGDKAGSELDNVNRWRQQLALDPVSEVDLVALQAPVKIGSSNASLYDQVSKENLIDGKYKTRTLAVMWPAGTMTIFFKASGEDALVAENKAKFVEWLASVQAGPEASGANPHGGTAAASPVATAPAQPPALPPASTGPLTLTPPSSGGGEIPEWTAPAAWKAGGPKPMRLASFEVPNPGGAPGDISISALGSAGGGLLANVNRWRGQVGMAPTDDATLAKEAKPLKLAGGSVATLVDLTGTGERILGAIVPVGDRTWFFKFKGDAALVGKERDTFVKFVESVKL